MARGIKRFNGMVRRAMMTNHRSRMRGTCTLTASTLNTQNLLTVDDDPDYDIATDFSSTIAEAESLSRLKRIDLNISFFSGTANGAGALVEWMLYRSPDDSLTGQNPSDLFGADVTLTTQSLRKNAIAYGGFLSSANNDTSKFKIGIKRKAMRRISRLSDGDRLKLAFVTSATGAKYFAYGTITWAK